MIHLQENFRMNEDLGTFPQRLYGPRYVPIEANRSLSLDPSSLPSASASPLLSLVRAALHSKRSCVAIKVLLDSCLFVRGGVTARSCRRTRTTTSRSRASTSRRGS